MSSPPLVAISPNYVAAEDRRLYKQKPLEYGEWHLASAVTQAGGLPVLAYRSEEVAASPERVSQQLKERAQALIARVDGLVLSGGVDICSVHYGETLRDPAWAGDAARDAFELALYEAAVTAGKPVLGICRGAQLIGVAEGGQLYQDLPSELSGAVEHRSQERYDGLTHEIELEDPFFEALFATEERIVNSVHHQGLRKVPESLHVVARAPDGLPEAYARRDAWVLGVQWHPEWMQVRASQRRLFEAFIAAARGDGTPPW